MQLCLVPLAFWFPHTFPSLVSLLLASYPCPICPWCGPPAAPPAWSLGPCPGCICKFFPGAPHKTSSGLLPSIPFGLAHTQTLGPLLQAFKPFGCQPSACIAGWPIPHGPVLVAPIALGFWHGTALAARSFHLGLALFHPSYPTPGRIAPCRYLSLGGAFMVLPPLLGSPCGHSFLPSLPVVACLLAPLFGHIPFGAPTMFAHLPIAPHLCLPGSHYPWFPWLYPWAPFLGHRP